MEPPNQQMEVPTSGGNIRVSVFNFSSQDITEGEISLLKLGLKFVPTTPIPEDDTKVDILRFSRKLLLKANFHGSEYIDDSVVKPKSCYIPKTVRSPILKGIIEDLEVFANEFPKNLRSKPVQDNLTVDQRLGFNVLKKRKGILVFKADKGAGCVLLNELFYKYKVLNLLNSSKYEKLPRNVDYFIMNKLKSFVKKYENVLNATERRALTNFDFCTTNIYGLPKIHKSKIIADALKNATTAYLHLRDPLDLSFRLIFGGPKNPCSMLAELVNTILEPFRTKIQSSLRDVFVFKQRIPSFKNEDLPFIEIVSVDVISMYENLTKNLGLPALKYFLSRYTTLLPSRFSVDFVIQAMSFVLDNNTGFFNGEFYRQKTGTATGIKPAPPYADLAMGYLEINLFYKMRAKLGEKIASYFWNGFMRYLDDGIIFWDKRLCDFDVIFNMMNEIDSSINFTMQRSDFSLKFLDVLIYKTGLGFETVVQDKDTDSNTFLNYRSSHPRHCRDGIPFSMARRIKALTDDDSKAHDQMKALSSKLLNAGYPIGLVNCATKSAMALSSKDLIKPKEKLGEEDVIAFVHTFDPAHPSLLWEIKNRISRLFTSTECRAIFGGTRIIDSRREPKNLLRIFQHSRFQETGSALYEKGVSRCGHKNCKLCAEIMETDLIYFNNANFTYRINARWDCTVRNVIYALFCRGCSKYYIGETVCLRNRASSHRSNSKSEDRAVMEVSSHIFNCGQGFKICPIFKLKEDCKILRLFVEDSLIKLLKPDLNRDQRNLLHLNLYV